MSDYDDQTLALAGQLAGWCQQHDLLVLADGCVREDVAAKLIDRSPGTLRNWRANNDRRLPWKRGVGCLRYDLRDIAAALRADGEPRDLT